MQVYVVSYLLCCIASSRGGLYSVPYLETMGLLWPLHLSGPPLFVISAFQSSQISHPAFWVFQHRQPAVPPGHASPPPLAACGPSQQLLTALVTHTLPELEPESETGAGDLPGPSMAHLGFSAGPRGGTEGFMGRAAFLCNLGFLFEKRTQISDYISNMHFIFISVCNSLTKMSK